MRKSLDNCRVCIVQALNVEAKCPLCKHPASRRDILRSELIMIQVLVIFEGLHATRQ